MRHGFVTRYLIPAPTLGVPSGLARPITSAGVTPTRSLIARTAVHGQPRSSHTAAMAAVSMSTAMKPSATSWSRLLGSQVEVVVRHEAAARLEAADRCRVILRARRLVDDGLGEEHVADLARAHAAGDADDQDVIDRTGVEQAFSCARRVLRTDSGLGRDELRRTDRAAVQPFGIAFERELLGEGRHLRRHRSEQTHQD